MVQFENGKIAEVPGAYLAGAIEFAKDWGVTWREKVTPKLTSLGYRAVNPLELTESTGKTPEELHELKKTSVEEFKEIISGVVKKDLDYVSKCEVVVCKIDEDVLRGAGTFGELTLCALMHIPVYAYIDLPNGIQDVPGWCIGCITEYRESFEEFLDIIPKASDVLEAKMNKFMELGGMLKL
jgi:hypothetical protein